MEVVDWSGRGLRALTAADVGSLPACGQCAWRLSGNCLERLDNLDHCQVPPSSPLSLSCQEREWRWAQARIVEVDLAGNRLHRITSLLPLRACLTVLDVPGNRLGSLHGLHQLVHLTNLNASDNQISVSFYFPAAVFRV